MNDFHSELCSIHDDACACHALEKLVQQVSFARPVGDWFLFTFPKRAIVCVQLSWLFS